MSIDFSYCRKAKIFVQHRYISVDIAVDRKAISYYVKGKKEMAFVEEQKLFLLPT
jgi:predicted transcriptional regulator